MITVYQAMMVRYIIVCTCSFPIVLIIVPITYRDMQPHQLLYLMIRHRYIYHDIILYCIQCLVPRPLPRFKHGSPWPVYEANNYYVAMLHGLAIPNFLYKNVNNTLLSLPMDTSPKVS